ncbi:hypothetical protein [Pedobacter sp. SYSU D00535]|uniref:hypothetical protein n=1 Tax=Pedobacter sp. SYSU D00535 TaxID=2810308 RepID=UPI001A956FAF|nr:hypothetical protein [Pedobacter sp. SYSU D00535]
MDDYKQAAYYDFALARQLQVSSYPALLLQNADNHFYLLAKGYADLSTMQLRIENLLKELNNLKTD